MSNHDIEGHVPAEAAPEADPAPSGAPDSLERQLVKEREARQLIRDRLRHTEALAAESHALRAKMAEELERVTADRDRLRTEARIAAAITPDEPPGAPAAADMPRPESAGTPRPPSAAGAPRVPPGPGPRSARGAEPTMSPAPPRPREPSEHPFGERPLKPPARRGPWRALAMLGGLAAAVAGLAWLTGTMPSGLDMASLPAAASALGLGSTPAASAPAQASAAQPGTTTATAVAAAAPGSMPAATPRGAVPLPPMSPEARLAAAPTAAGPAAPASAAVPAPVPAPPPNALRGQSQLQAAGGLDVRLRKALDGEGIASRVEIDPASGHVRVADTQDDAALRERTDMLIRAVYAGASLPEPQIEHRWLSPMQGERQDAAQAQGPAPTNPRPPALAQGQPRQRQQHGSPAVGLATRHVEARARTPVAGIEELRPVVPAGRITEGCMADIAGQSSNRRAALTACMKQSCCSGSANHNSEECRAYQKAYPYTCGAG